MIPFLPVLVLFTPQKGATPDTRAAARFVLRDWSQGKIPWYAAPPLLSSSAEGDEVVLKGLPTRKEVRKAGGLVKFAPGRVDEREIALEWKWMEGEDAASGTRGDAGEEGEEDLEDEGDVDGEEFSSEDASDVEDEDDAAETPPPTPPRKRKRAPEIKTGSPSPRKKVSFAPQVKGGKARTSGGVANSGKARKAVNKSRRGMR